jgi:hypothetical protein
MNLTSSWKHSTCSGLQEHVGGDEVPGKAARGQHVPEKLKNEAESLEQDFVIEKNMSFFILLELA